MLFRFPAAARRDPAVEAWFRSRSPESGVIARTWFDHMRRCGSDVRELMHEDCPVARVEEVAVGYVNTFSSHVNVGIFQVACLDDPAGLLEGEGKRMRHVKLRSDPECNQQALIRLIEDAYVDVKRRIAQSLG